MRRQFKNIFLGLALAILIGSFVTPSAQAQFVPVNIDFSPLSSANITAINASNAESLVQDLLEWAVELADEQLRKELVDWMVEEMVSFIGSGDNGSPRFVQDWFSFLSGSNQQGQNAVTNHLANSNICGSFKSQILQALGGTATGSSDNEVPFGCSIDETDRGSFSSWDSYMSSLQPENNYILSLISAETLQTSAGQRAEKAAEAEAIAGGGFWVIPKMG